MRNRNSVLCGVGLIALLAAQVAWAAPPKIDPETPPITAQFSATYDSNVAGSSAAFATARGLKRSDVDYEPALLANVMEPLGGISLFLAGQAGYDFYQQNSVLNRERIDLQAGANANVDVCDTTLMGSWGRHQSSLADLSLGTTKNTEQDLGVEGDVACSRMGRFYPTASISQTWSTDSAPTYFSQDHNSLAANASMAYNAEELGTVSVIGQYQQATFPNRILGISGQQDGYNLYGGGLHYERNFGATIQLGASIWDTSISTDNHLGKNFSGITYDATLGYKPGPRLSFNLAFSRTASPSYYLNAAYSVDEKYSGEADYRITSRLTAKLGASDINTDFAGAALIPGTDITHQTFWSYYGGLAFNVSPTLSVSLNAGENQRHADVLGYSYSGGYVGLAVSKAF